jgi:tRNA (guanine37-N1)-methyltransferase
MKIDVMTLFPEVIDSYTGVSIVKRARDKDLISITATNFREFSENKHKQVDDYPFGGGAGMVLSPQPIVDAIRSVKEENSYTIYLTPKGKPFDQEMARNLSEKNHLILVCGHYEGLDQRVIDHHIDQEISIGDYVLSGGELPALVIIDAVTRLLPGAIKEDSLSEESFTSYLLEYAHYTRPRSYEGEEIPEILLSGHHKNIEQYRLIESIRETLIKRPDLIEQGHKAGAFDRKLWKLISKVKNDL